MNNGKTPPRITILGVGNILLSDEGVGVRVVEFLNAHYSFTVSPGNTLLQEKISRGSL